MGHSFSPILNGHTPFSRNVIYCQVQGLKNRIIARKKPLIKVRGAMKPHFDWDWFKKVYYNPDSFKGVYKRVEMPLLCVGPVLV